MKKVSDSKKLSHKRTVDNHAAPLSTLPHALALGERGMRVIPVGTDKKPFIRAWPKVASSAPEKIREWWKRFPEAQVAVLTGREGGCSSIDVDGSTGEESFRRLEELLGISLTSVVEETTPRGGRHLLFKSPGGVILKRMTPIPGFDDLDFIGEKSYLIVSPSVSTEGSYHWKENASIFNHELPELPEPLIELLLSKAQTATKEKKKKRKKEEQSAGSTQNEIPEGTRNSKLTSIAGAMHRQGSSPEVILSTIRSENMSRCKPPLPEAELKAIVRSISKYRQEAGQCENCTHEVLWQPPGGSTATIEQVLAAAKEYLPAHDLLPVRACCAAYCTKLHPGASVNLVVTGGQLPAEVVSSLKGLPLVKRVDRVTPSGLLCSLPRSYLPMGTPAGLLEEVGSNGVFAVTELTSLLNQQGKRSRELLTVLDGVLSGSHTAQPGAGGVSRIWSGDICMIAGIKGEIDTQRVFLDTIGQRFIIARSRMNPFDFLKTSSRTLDLGSREVQRQAFCASVKGLVAGLTVIETLPSIPEAESNILRKAGIMTAVSRSRVIRDRDGNPLDAGVLEDPTQFTDQLSSLFHAYMIIGISVNETISDIVEVAFHSISPWLRARLLLALHEHPGFSSLQLSRLLHRARTTTRRELEALRMLRMVIRRGSEDSWEPSPEAAGLLEDLVPHLKGKKP